MSRSHYDPQLKGHVYDHENFSELGDALVGHPTYYWHGYLTAGEWSEC